jgi:23S rRNA (cytosine1962-C5)-methyltransferase
LNRTRVRELSNGRSVLDCFCYTGGFTLNAIKGGAKSVTSIDASESAIGQAQKNIFLNNLPEDIPVTWLVSDVFKELRLMRDKDNHFDMIILDPPKFAPTAAQVERAARGYKDINLLAMKLLRPGGILVTFSCSGGVSVDLFQKIVAGAALDAKVDIQILEWLHQSPDHPVALNFPEGVYLKGLVLQLR